MISALSIELSDQALTAEISGQLAMVEEGLYEATRSSDPTLAESSRHLISAGGKRLRPFLVLLAAQFGDPHDERLVPAAVALELTHIGTLYHDDVMDGAALRRGVPSANARWGNVLAVLTGDYLLACATRILASIGTDAVRIQAETFARLVEGQKAETLGPRQGDNPISHHLSVLREKTASLFAACGEFGGLFSGAPAEVTLRIKRACEAWGIAYQLSDDLLDVASDSSESGKTPGTDLREGVPTLPMLHALGSSRPADARLVELLKSGELEDPALHAEALALLRANPAMDLARADARKWAGIARQEILGLPDVQARAAFLRLCDWVTERTG
jgi:heptaprenyl diphosphate synthase